ncbi:DUF6602 domain-containing protein [Paenibacillus sp.]|uniref:DUF6602 domain-containing protein n=1 Tax=Paenibacillus sp. TaxID=58172 RepID=UPI00281F3D6A|nr:DUF6602 domain-containing protein [Paenibacillus sp.]MDR0266844.1 hypothetical protein [Paenibacillus sp.]
MPTDSISSEQTELKKGEKEIIVQIKDNYVQLEQSITKQLKMAAAKHHVTSGTFREDIWKSMFEQIIPKKFSIEQSVFIIDSEGGVSKEVDLAIFDEQYTPYIFRYGRIMYIPIEAVAVVIQCKSNNLSKKDLVKWSDSITKLNTSLKSITRMFASLATGEYAFDKDGKQFMLSENEGGKKPLTQTSTRPIQILCHTKEGSDKHIPPFDIVINSKNERLQISWLDVTKDPGEEDIPRWFDSLNHKNDDKEGKYRGVKSAFDDVCKKETRSDELKGALKLNNYKVFNDKEKKEEIGLLSLNFQLNQLLMLINNPILFPHKAYVDMFNNFCK